MAKVLRSTAKKSQRIFIEPLLIAYAVIAFGLLSIGGQLYIHSLRIDRVLPEGSYQAVFLTNGQVYFGQLQALSRSFLELEDVYYLQEDVSAAEATADSEDVEQPKISIVRLGEELHQPFNHVVLNKDHILLWETLQPNSRVLKAISEDKAQ